MVRRTRPGSSTFRVRCFASPRNDDCVTPPLLRSRRKPSLMSTIDLAFSPSDLRSLAEQSNAWPFEQAKAIVARLKKAPKDEVLFETGYGPSWLTHLRTFGEVARTTMVLHAFRVLTEDKIRTRLIAFSDDMDGLRKVPDNVPNREMMAQHLGKPLTQVPDPFGTHTSF